MNTHLAIKTGDTDLVKERIETRQIHVSYEFGGLSALHLAVMYSQTTIVSLLLQAGADVNCKTDSTCRSSFDIPTNSTPLYVAIQFNNPDILRILLVAGAKVNEKDLILAIEQEDLEIVKCLLENMQWQNEAYTISKIFESIFNHNNHELLKLFIKPELIDANTVLPSGKSLLYHSVKAGNLEICRLLIDRGAEVDFAFPVHLSTSNRRNEYYKDTSVLSVAVSTGNYELVQLLLDSGANPNGYFSNGTKGKNIQSKDIPIVIAVKNHFIDIVSLLIDTDANVHVCEDGSNGGWYADKTLFGIAIGNQLLDVVKLLIESAGADPNNDFHSNGRLFEKAVSTKNEELILYLLQEGIVAAKYLDKTTKSFSKEEDQELVTRLYNEAKALLYNNNKQVLTQFFVYLSTDKNSIISKLPEDVRNCIADYTATGSQKLNSLTFENYVKHHPIEDSNVVEGTVILGQSTCEEVN